MKSLTIGNLAKASGVGIETVRFYERKGLLPKPARRDSGYREYRDDDAKRIQFIRRSQELGFTLKEIQQLLELTSDPKTKCADLRRTTESKLDEVRAKIQDLQRMKRSLEKLMRACEQGKSAVRGCRMFDCFDSGCAC